MSFPKNDHLRVLLIDRDSMKRQLRAIALRNCDIEVHSASNIAEACHLCGAHCYDLVLVAAEGDSEVSATACVELKKHKPKQRIALLVGAPQFVREVGREARKAQLLATAPAPRLAIGASHSRPTQWRAMMERLLLVG